MLSTSLIAKILSLYSDQNSWPVGPMETSEQNLTEFLLLLLLLFLQ